MTYTFTAVFLRAEDGGVAAYVEELPGAVAHGPTIMAARTALRLVVEFILARNRRITREISEDADAFWTQPITVGHRGHWRARGQRERRVQCNYGRACRVSRSPR